MLDRLVVIGACHKARAKMALEKDIGSMEACLAKSSTPLDRATMKVVVNESGALEPKVDGVNDADSRTCLVDVMKQLNIKKTGPGMCLVRWGLR